MAVRRAKPWLLIGVALFLFAGLLLWLVEQQWRHSTSTRLQRALAESASHARPSVSEILATLPPVSDADNALSLYRDAALLTEPPADGASTEALITAYGLYTERPEEVTAEETAALDAMLEKMPALFSLLDQAGEKSCHFDFDAGSGGSTARDEAISQIRRLICRLQVMGLRAMHRGDMETAVRCFVCSVSILAGIKDSPIRRVVTVRGNGMTNLRPLCAEILGSTRIQPRHIDAMRNALATLEGGASLIPAIEEERRQVRHFFETLESKTSRGTMLPPLQPNHPLNQCVFWLWTGSHFRNEDFATSMEYYELLLNQLEQHTPWSLYDGSHPLPAVPNSLGTFFSSTIVPDNPGWFLTSHVSSISSLRMMQLACEITRYRLDEHALPAAIDGIPGDGTDPFTGKPFHYLRSDAGFDLRSAGEDGRFDDDANVRNDLVLSVKRR